MPPITRKTRIRHGNSPPAPPAADVLLAWYDAHARRLPWRAPAGTRADPYHVWLSEIMLQQTTVMAVAPYYQRFLARFPTLPDLAAAKLEEVLKLWAGLGYYARARHLHACARAILARHGGQIPASEAELRALPGIGPYTAAAVAAIAFELNTTPVDGNVERVVARLFAVEEPLPAAKPHIRALAASLTPQHRPGDFAQAMMDLGATLCTPKAPSCLLCPWQDACAAHRRGEAARFPRKQQKTNGALRRGVAFVALRSDGALLVRTRPDTGLLAKMTEVPTSDWRADFEEAEAFAQAPILSPPLQGGRERACAWHRLPAVVRHTFTHFPLELAVYRADLPRGTRAPEGTRWLAARDIAGEAFPTVMRKVIAAALNEVRGLANLPRSCG